MSSATSTSKTRRSFFWPRQNLTISAIKALAKPSSLPSKSDSKVQDDLIHSHGGKLTHPTQSIPVTSSARIVRRFSLQRCSKRPVKTPTAFPTNQNFGQRTYALFSDDDDAARDELRDLADMLRESPSPHTRLLSTKHVSVNSNLTTSFKNHSQALILEDCLKPIPIIKNHCNHKLDGPNKLEARIPDNSILRVKNKKRARLPKFSGLHCPSTTTIPNTCDDKSPTPFATLPKDKTEPLPQRLSNDMSWTIERASRISCVPWHKSMQHTQPDHNLATSQKTKEDTEGNHKDAEFTGLPQGTLLPAETIGTTFSGNALQRPQSSIKTTALPFLRNNLQPPLSPCPSTPASRSIGETNPATPHSIEATSPMSTLCEVGIPEAGFKNFSECSFPTWKNVDVGILSEDELCSSADISQLFQDISFEAGLGEESVFCSHSTFQETCSQPTISQSYQVSSLNKNRGPGAEVLATLQFLSDLCQRPSSP